MPKRKRKFQHIVVGEDDLCRTLLLEVEKDVFSFTSTVSIIDRTSSGSVSWEPTVSSLREAASVLSDMADWMETEENPPEEPQAPTLSLVNPSR